MSRKYGMDSNMGGLGGRIDTRPPSEAKARGFRNIHRDTDGSVISYTDTAGRAVGEKARPTGPLMSRLSLGNPITPGLDANAAANAGAPPATNLAGRQALHADMVKAGSGGLTPEMQSHATALGVPGSSFRRVAAGIPQAPAAIAAAVPSAKPAPFYRQPAAAPAPALTGKALAESNIAKMGVRGTIAHMQKNEAMAKTKRAQDVAAGQVRSKFRSASAMPAPISSTAAPSATPTFEKAAGLPEKTPQQALTARFAAPVGKNFQAIATPPAEPVAPQPVSEFQQLTTPKPVATAAPAAMPAKPQAASAIKQLATRPNIGSDGFVSLGAPLADAAARFKKEEAKGYKAPLRSATLAGVTGVRRLGADIAKSYR